jgi:hypothetical protein
LSSSFFRRLRPEGGGYNRQTQGLAVFLKGDGPVAALKPGRRRTSMLFVARMEE